MKVYTIGFTKGSDLEYFLKAICSCKYEHCVNYAPTKEILDDYRKKVITWSEYERQYTALMNERGAVKDFYERFSDYNMRVEDKECSPLDVVAVNVTEHAPIRPQTENYVISDSVWRKLGSMTIGYVMKKYYPPEASYQNHRPGLCHQRLAER